MRIGFRGSLKAYSQKTPFLTDSYMSMRVKTDVCTYFEVNEHMGGWQTHAKIALLPEMLNNNPRSLTVAHRDFSHMPKRFD